MLKTKINFPKQVDSSVIGWIIIWMWEKPFPIFKPPYILMFTNDYFHFLYFFILFLNFGSAKVIYFFELCKFFMLKFVNRLQNFHYLHRHHCQYTIPMCQDCQISLQDSCLSFLTLHIRSYFPNCRSH